MTDASPAELARLVRAVAVLAMPTDGQIAWLGSLGLGEPGFVDELALELDNGALLVGQFVRAGWVTPEFREGIVALDLFLSSKSALDTSDFWSVDSLRDDEDWELVRSMAAAVLQTL
ncbi:hypothetical protein [Promicromonospora sukumoe]|uniref:hypothetical protein n=1 Tax=Promicromonospora sukumoe TaxID=88382 RepID=UPI003648E00F